MAVPAILTAALQTRRRFGIGLARQFRQATRLRWGKSRLDPWEYFFFQVFLDRYPMAEKRLFIGWRREIALDRSLNTGRARDLANDKLRFAAIMQTHDVPLPRIAAVFHPGGRNLPGAVQLADADAVARYLAQTSDYPLFVKPIRGAHGWSACIIQRASDDGMQLELAGGRTVATDEFAAGLGRRGLIFQQLLRTHVDIGAICGDRLTSVRIVVLIDDHAPRILSAVWRVPTGANVTDNFSVGTTGNLIAGVDVATGATGAVFQGAGWENLPTANHPDTGGQFGGLRLPAWHETAELCLTCASHFPDLRLQHWDIALTEHGPVVLELNVEGGLRTHQIVAAGPANLRPLADL